MYDNREEMGLLHDRWNLNQTFIMLAVLCPSVQRDPLPRLSDWAMQKGRSAGEPLAKLRPIIEPGNRTPDLLHINGAVNHYATEI